MGCALVWAFFIAVVQLLFLIFFPTLDSIVMPSLLLPSLWPKHVMKIQIVAICCYYYWQRWHAISFLIFVLTAFLLNIFYIWF